MYSKGDAIKFKGDVVGIVLKDGLTGIEFFQRYAHKEFLEIFYNLGSWTTTYKTDKYLRNYVWYYVLVGDRKGWFGHHISWPHSYNDAVQ